MKCGGGVPARFIHYRVRDEKIRVALANTKWWDADEKTRREYIDRFRSNLDGVEDVQE